MANYLALLGWNPGSEQEVFSLAELRAQFDLARVQKAGAIFDREKLDWLNGQWIRGLTEAELDRRLEPYLPRLDAGDRHIATAALRERLQRLDQAPEMLAYLWREPEPPGDGPAEVLDEVASALEAVDWRPDPIEGALGQVVERLGLSRGKVFGAVRAAVTGQKVAPPIHFTLALLPKERALARLRRAASG
jgi:glutamyl-tRNA synthetase